METRDSTRYSHALLPLGLVTVTSAALREFYRSDSGLLGLLDWHRAGKWGDAEEEYGSMNDQALWDGGTVVSIYEIGLKTQVIITTKIQASTRVVWGAREAKEIAIRHTRNAPERFSKEALPRLYACRRALYFVTVL
jgi:hypothetical protein